MMADGLKRHSHADRQRIIDAVGPQIRAHFGTNLVAISVYGSFARQSDGAYSDIEFRVFVKRAPRNGRWRYHVIWDGLLIEIDVFTVEGFLDRFKTRIESGGLYASDAMAAVYNAPLILELDRAPRTVTWGASQDALRARWVVLQEATSKVLNASEGGDAASISILYWNMAYEALMVLALLNERPISTLGRIVSEARTFAHKPACFDDFVAPPTSDAPTLGRLALQAFGEIEALLYARGIRPYAETLDLFAGVPPEGNVHGMAVIGDAIGRALQKCYRVVRRILGSHAERQLRSSSR